MLASGREVLETVAQQVAVILERRLGGRDAGDPFLCVIEGLARAAEANMEDAAHHIVRVGEYAAELARALNLPHREVQSIRLAARVHDVGKLHVPREILLKPGPLSEDERREVQRHTLYGAQILAGLPHLRTARQTALFHHECWDGSGYPHGLRGEEIPLPARIVRLADVYDALRSARVYKPPLDHPTACRIILEGDERTRPSHFDPWVLRAFRRVAGRLAELFEAGCSRYGEEP
ncbi:MAG: HD-GYP domain-containing protein [Firmicutes bacterium]|nr:HD-GYP domain-containing protein [Bacillota bacterium]